MTDENQKTEETAVKDSLPAPTWAEMERRLKRSEDASRSLSDAVDYLQNRNRNLCVALDRIANCYQDCSDRNAIYFMREIARLALDSDNAEDTREAKPTPKTKE